MKKFLLLLLVIWTGFATTSSYAQTDMSWVIDELDELSYLYSAFQTDDSLCYGVIDTCGNLVTVLSNVSEWNGKYTGRDSIVIPPKVVFNSVEYIVVGIDGSAFSDCTDIEVLILPSTIFRINRFAFAGCTHLRRLDLGDNLILASATAFIDCYMLKEIVLPQFTYMPDLCMLKEYDLPKFVDKSGRHIICPDEKQ